MKITKQAYADLSASKTPPTNHTKNILLAFLAGGVICAIGQGITAWLLSIGQSKQDAATLTAMILIAAGALLTGLKFYKAIAKHAGAGITVPITGFANAIVASASEFKQEGYILGMGAKMFTIAGPVIVFGLIASIIYGVVLVLVG